MHYFDDVIKFYTLVCTWSIIKYMFFKLANPYWIAKNWDC